MTVRPEHRLLELALVPAPSGPARKELRSLAGHGLDWEFVAKAAGRLGTLSVLSRALESAGLRPEGSLREACRAATQINAVRVLVAEKMLAEVVGRLESARIQVMVLKGSVNTPGLGCLVR